MDVTIVSASFCLPFLIKYLMDSGNFILATKTMTPNIIAEEKATLYPISAGSKIIAKKPTSDAANVPISKAVALPDDTTRPLLDG